MTKAAMPRDPDDLQATLLRIDREHVTGPPARLRTALEDWFRLVMDEADGRLPARERVRLAYDYVQVSWRECGDEAERVYQEAVSAWRKKTGRDQASGERIVPAA